MSLADEANYDESKVPVYELPSPLAAPDGRQVSTAFEWASSQRGHVLSLFENLMYGPVPPRPEGLRFELLSVKDGALGGLAVRKEIRIHCQGRGVGKSLDLLLYIPKGASKPVPAFVGLNFLGNHAATDEQDVAIAGKPRNPGGEIAARGGDKDRWQFEEVVRRGYASATVFHNDIYPDHYAPAKREESVYALFGAAVATGGAISAWAWGLSRAMDYLESEPAVDSRRVAVHGHSRLGKTALWAGASDQRFAMVVSNDSGCGGAALSRRLFGETIGCFPKQCVGYWFIPEFYEYIGKEDELPFDQHMLVSLMAPRPVYVASATEDLWADPKGEFLSAAHAAPVYRLFGDDGLGTAAMPPPDTSIGNAVGYHIRTGKHDITEFDWRCYLDFADHNFAKK